MDTNYLPLWKTLDTPFFSLSESHVELFSVLALFGLSLVALAVRWRRQAMRHLVQVISLLVFFYIVYSCLGVFGMIRNLVHGTGLIGTAFTESFFWMSLPLVVLAFSLTGGPFFCGWICPTGTIQEALAALREHTVRLVRRARPAPGRPRPLALGVTALLLVSFLGVVGWLGTTKRFYVEDSSLYWGGALLVLVFLTLGRWADDRRLRVLRGVSFAIILGSSLARTMIVSPVHFAFADVRDPASALTTAVLALASLFVSRAWCRYVCPWGFLMGCTARVARLQVAVREGCTACGRCTRTCRVAAIRDGTVRLADCQFCLACVDGCPQGALEVVDRWRTGAPGAD